MSDRVSCERAFGVVSGVFEVARRFPDVVVKDEHITTTFCEFGAVFSADLWPALTELAAAHGDDYVHLVVVEPDVDRYVAGYGVWPALSLPVTASADDYWDAINEAPRGDATASLLEWAEIVAFGGDSGTWGCWGERDPEIAAFHGFALPVLDGWRERHGPFLDAADALESYIAPSFQGRAVPDDFSAAFLRNYGL